MGAGRGGAGRTCSYCSAYRMRWFSFASCSLYASSASARFVFTSASNCAFCSSKLRLELAIFVSHVNFTSCAHTSTHRVHVHVHIHTGVHVRRTEKHRTTAQTDAHHSKFVALRLLCTQSTPQNMSQNIHSTDKSLRVGSVLQISLRIEYVLYIMFQYVLYCTAITIYCTCEYSSLAALE